jgi:two-component system, OmpR family, response regulator
VERTPGNVRHVLLVEDDDEQANLTRSFLRAYGVEVSHARTINDACVLLDAMPFDVVVLDRMLNGTDSVAWLSDLRHRHERGVLMVSARGGETDRILGLEGGADDYLAKPYNPHELLARIKALHRHTTRRGRGTRAGRTAMFGAWTLHLATYRLSHASGRSCDLTAGELSLLRGLLDNPGAVLSRNQLLALTRHDDGDVFDRTIDTLIVRLRRKLEDNARKPQLIQTIRGGGYRLKSEVSWKEG